MTRPLTLQTTVTDDGQMYEVCAHEDGIKACCFVSSMHLIPQHEKQLRDAVRRKALNAFVEDAAKRGLKPLHSDSESS